MTIAARPRAPLAVMVGAALVVSALGCHEDSHGGDAGVTDASVATDEGGIDAGGVHAGSVDAGGVGDASLDSDASFTVVGSVTTVENLGASTASRAMNGLGWNLTLGSEWEFKAAHDAGATRARMQCSWASVELQSAAPANTSAGFALPANCQQSLTLAKQYGLRPTLVAAFGAPFHALVKLSLASAASTGATTLAVTLDGSGSLSSIAFPYAYLLGPTSNPISVKHSYPGTLITKVAVSDSTHATLTLASALTADLPAASALTVDQQLYPAATSTSATDASVVAYTKYVQYLGSQCAATGVECDIELWNEPPWGDDCWDNAIDCYDASPGYDEESSGPNWGFVAALQSTTPAAGVTYTWAGTNKSGDNSVLGTKMQTYAGVAYAQPNTAVTVETLHPYGNNPEDAAWNQPCLVASVANKTNGFACNLVANSTSNAYQPSQLALAARATSAADGIDQAISETGTSTDAADEVHKARFVTRQYLAYLADDIDYLEFYRLYDDSAAPASGFSFVEPTSGLGYTPLPAYTALASLVADATIIHAAPVQPYAPAGTDGVQVGAYAGTYPLDIVQFVGSRAGDSLNSLLVALYQRSFVTTPCSPTDRSVCWGSLAPPPSTAVTLTAPLGLTLSKVVDLVTQQDVPHRQVGSAITLEVSDDPVEVLLTPE